MPYYGSLTVPFYSRRSYSEMRFITFPIKSTWPGNSSNGPLVYSGDQHTSFRVGVNSSFNAANFEPVGIPKFTFKRVFLGYEDVVTKSLRRVHRKDGLTFKISTSTRQRKRFGKSLVYSYESYKVKKGVYLKPNQLQFNSAEYSQLPTESPFIAMFNYYEPSPNAWIGTVVKGQFMGSLFYMDTHPGSLPKNFRITTGPANGSHITQPLIRPTISPDAKARALIKLYEKILDETPNYYSMLAESGETLDSLRSIAMSGLRLAKDLYRLNGKAILARTKEINLRNAADVYLGWIYGISPLISDLKKAVENHSRMARVWRTYSSGVFDHLHESEQGPQWLDGKAEYVYRSYCRYGVTLDGVMSLSRLLKRAQSWEQTAATVYEVVPFSFMLDWLVDISGYLNAVNVVEGRAIDAWYTEGLVSYRYEAGKPRVFQSGPVPTDFSIDISLPNMSIVSKSIYCNRVPLSGLPAMPKPIVPTASTILDGISLQRGINALAIAVSRQFGLKDRWSRELRRSNHPPLILRGI